jgi:predicted dehydrogenase
LEKPIATTMEDCEVVLDAATRNNRKVFVAHVLRYTPFYNKLKDIIDSGKLGEVLSIHASENIGFFHFANSYVRGNWHRKEDSTPIILAKCCHDMDIIAYLMNEQCISISSVGTLSHFNEENAPKNSTEYCSDCPLGSECVYNAQRVYTTYGRSFAGYFFNGEGTDEEIIEALKKTGYDKCVYHNDNDVVDHQSTVMLFKNGKTAVHTMVAFSKEIYRDIKIYGTKAELVGCMEENFIEIRNFGGEVEKIPLEISNNLVGGHCGGDNYFMRQVYNALNDQPCKGITYLDVSVQSHRMAFAAEESREKGGALIQIG